MEEERGTKSHLLHPFLSLLPLDASDLLPLLGASFLQLLRRAEGLVHVGCKLLHLVVHQQVLRNSNRKSETNSEVDGIYSALTGPKRLQINQSVF